jgi:hypothetical protein
MKTMNKYKVTTNINSFALEHERLQMSVCVLCRKVANRFTDVFSRNEYDITGICEHCQNRIGYGEDMSDEG